MYDFAIARGGEEQNEKLERQNVEQLLMMFFEFYGYEFNEEQCAISIKHDDGPFISRERWIREVQETYRDQCP